VQRNEIALQCATLK